MGENKFLMDTVSEGWKKEYEKFLLSQKYSKVCTLLGQALTEPTLQNAKTAYGTVTDYVCSIPISVLLHSETQKTRDELVASLDKIGVALYGDLRNQEVLTTVASMGLGLVCVRTGVQNELRITNIPKVIIETRNILIAAGDFAVTCGLRVSVSERKKRGKDKLLEEEGFENDSLDNEE